MTAALILATLTERRYRIRKIDITIHKSRNALPKIGQIRLGVE